MCDPCVSVGCQAAAECIRVDDHRPKFIHFKEGFVFTDALRFIEHGAFGLQLCEEAPKAKKRCQ